MLLVNKKNLSLIVLEAGKPEKINVADLTFVSDGDLLPDE
jgi:hypothetical protein